MTDEEWKTVGKFEAILRDTCRLTAICQNEERLNSVYGPIVRNYLYDSLSSRNMCIINTDLWVGNTAMIHPARSEDNVTSITNIGRTCLKRTLLECEKSRFKNKTEYIFVESN